jgi:hypothetical protein
MTMSAPTFDFSRSSGYMIRLPLPSAIAHPKIREALEDLIAKDAVSRQAGERVQRADAAFKAASQSGRPENRAAELANGPADLDELTQLATAARTAEADAKAALVEAREVARMATEVARHAAGKVAATIDANQDEWRGLLIAEAAKARDKMANGLRAIENATDTFDQTLGIVEMLDRNRDSGDFSKLVKQPAPGYIKATIGITELRIGFGLLSDRVDRA